MSLLITACGSDDGEEQAVSVEAPSDDATAATETAIPNCRDSRNIVLFSVFGAATEGAPNEVSRWASDPETQQPVVRSGAAEIATAYRERGYHIFYASLESAATSIGDRPLADAIAIWLGLNGFPVGGDDTHIWTWEGAGEASVALIEELFYLTSEGAELHAGYAGHQEMARVLGSSGIPRERLFEMDRDEDLTEQLPAVQALEPVCR